MKSLPELWPYRGASGLRAKRSGRFELYRNRPNANRRMRALPMLAACGEEYFAETATQLMRRPITPRHQFADALFHIIFFQNGDVSMSTL